jgi:hypothetical protein
VKAQFKLHNPKPGQWLPEPYDGNMNWDLDVLPRKGERVNLGGWMFDVVQVEHEIDVKTYSVAVIYLKAH